MNRQQIIICRFLGVFFILLGLAGPPYVWYVAKKQREIESDGIAAVAKVVNAEVVAFRRGTNHYVTLCYPLPSGQAFYHQQQIPDDVHARAVKDGVLRIKFDPQHPDSVAFLDFPYSDSEKYIVDGIMTIVGIIISTISFCCLKLPASAVAPRLEIVQQPSSVRA